MSEVLLDERMSTSAHISVLVVLLLIALIVCPYVGIRYLSSVSKASRDIMTCAVKLMDRTKQLHFEKKEIENLLYKVK